MTELKKISTYIKEKAISLRKEGYIVHYKTDDRSNTGTVYVAIPGEGTLREEVPRIKSEISFSRDCTNGRYKNNISGLYIRVKQIIVEERDDKDLERKVKFITRFDSMKGKKINNLGNNPTAKRLYNTLVREFGN